MKDFAIPLSHRSGELARVAGALSRLNVNLQSVAGLAVGNQVLLRVIAEDAEAARTALLESNIEFEEHEVIKVLLENKAGELAEVANKLGKQGVNLQAVYLTGIVDDMVELAIIADDPKKARKLLE
jgi:hypothetical protein